LLEEAASKEFILRERIEEVHQLEERVEELQASQHTLNSEFEAYQSQYDLSVNEITNEFNFKLQTTTR
jgi:uncharacterized protein YlxW (UPF0749 family)